jgi:hypothetical protein
VFGPADKPIAETGVTPDEGGWRVARGDAGSVRLFEVPQTALENVVLT